MRGKDPERTIGRGYYEGVCFKLYASDATGAELETATPPPDGYLRELRAGVELEFRP